MADAIDSPYDKIRIDNARSKFKILQSKKNELSPSQWEEFDNFDKYLSVYYLGVDEFKDIITEISSIIEEYDGGGSETARRDCIGEINGVLKSDKNNRQTIIVKVIENIPYLRSRFEKYQKWATSNPLKKGEDIKTIESEILNLKITD